MIMTIMMITLMIIMMVINNNIDENGDNGINDDDHSMLIFQVIFFGESLMKNLTFCFYWYIYAWAQICLAYCFFYFDNTMLFFFLLVLFFFLFRFWLACCFIFGTLVLARRVLWINACPSVRPYVWSQYYFGIYSVVFFEIWHNDTEFSKTGWNRILSKILFCLRVIKMGIKGAFCIFWKFLTLIFPGKMKNHVVFCISRQTPYLEKFWF